MTIRELIQKIKTSSPINQLYHFTDKGNLSSIREHGILSGKLRKANGIENIVYLSSEGSRIADEKQGISSYVSLCMTRNHPMSFRATEEARNSQPVYLKIDPEILAGEGVYFAPGIANSHDISITLLAESLDKIDQKSLYTRTNWGDTEEFGPRRRAVEKYEILIPHQVLRENIIGGV